MRNDSRMQLKVVLWDRDIKATCSLAKCKQLNLTEQQLYCYLTQLKCDQ